ncbi:response regulator [Opitutus terrae]|uniref:Response regulator receiver protein n=1 Tax=Opitutus terrae (strain DSM 11246 / JCM 15787 / PB90-1) TaxID=452637 RepID=B1ZZF1_OPITP|nr:response regulator [Opitutus terrae]ACB76354.1 response regulator receiver protein [Opitutus terrae PB90-1]
MELVDAPARTHPGFASPVAGGSRPAASPRPSELRDLMAAANAAATIPADQDYAIWEDVCRRLAAEKKPAPVRPAPGPGPRTVLVADEAPALRETMRKTLAAAGYEVVCVEDAAKLLLVAPQRKADLIILAMVLAGSDGAGLIAQLRELAMHRCTPIMMLTAPGQDGKKIAARRAGASGWIAKPFDPARFVAIIQQVCPGC